MLPLLSNLTAKPSIADVYDRTGVPQVAELYPPTKMSPLLSTAIP